MTFPAISEPWWHTPYIKGFAGVKCLLVNVIPAQAGIHTELSNHIQHRGSASSVTGRHPALPSIGFGSRMAHAY
jgi:hypothetical protein